MEEVNKIVEEFFKVTKGVKVSIVKQAIESFKNAIDPNSVMMTWEDEV